MTTDELPRVGCIGAGAQGAPIMQRLAERGFAPLVWNRNRERLAGLRGVEVADSPAALCAACDIVLVCVLDGSAVEAIIFGDDGVAENAASGKLVIDCSTIEPGHAKAMAARLRETTGMGWLDAPVSGGPPAASEGSLTIMVGGAADDFERARPVFDAIAGLCTHMGPQGAGLATKMINQVLVGCGFAMVAEATGLAMRAGLDPRKIPAALAGGRADSAVLSEYMPRMAEEQVPVGGRMAVMLKDLKLIDMMRSELDASMPMTALVTEMYRKLVADGFADSDNATLAMLYKPRP